MRMGRADEKSFERLDILTVELSGVTQELSLDLLTPREIKETKQEKIPGSGEVRTRAGFPHWESSKIT